MRLAHFFLSLGFLPQTFMIHVAAGKREAVSLSHLYATSSRFSDSYTLAGILLQRAHLYT